MTETIDTSKFRTVDAASMAASERVYPKGHFVAFDAFSEECGNSPDFESLVEELLSRGFTPKNSLIVRIGDDDEMLFFTSEPN